MVLNLLDSNAHSMVGVRHFRIVQKNVRNGMYGS